MHFQCKFMIFAAMTVSIIFDARPVNASGSSGRQLAVVWNDLSSGTGWVQLMDTNAPWEFTTPPLEIGSESLARYAHGVLHIVSQSDSTITAIDPLNWTVEQVYPLGAGSDPLDIAAVDATTAYVTRRSATHLLRLDLDTGATGDVVDLSLFADSDGVPDLGMMALHEGRLFIQIRRQDTEAGPFVPPAYLAVVDVATEQLIDADPVAPGVQAIELAGTAAKLKMKVISETRRLIVSATGEFFDLGGIEIIDLDSLQSLGLVVEEESDQVGADVGAFVLVRPDRGFLTSSTDFGVSSHMVPFTIAGGADGTTTFYDSVGYYVPVLVLDAFSDTFFFPEGAFPDLGVHVFAASYGTRLTPEPIAIGGVPTDIELVCPGSESCDSAGVVPVTSAWGLAAMCVFISLGGAYVLRRKMRQVAGQT